MRNKIGFCQQLNSMAVLMRNSRRRAMGRWSEPIATARWNTLASLVLFSLSSAVVPRRCLAQSVEQEIIKRLLGNGIVAERWFYERWSASSSSPHLSRNCVGARPANCQSSADQSPGRILCWQTAVSVDSGSIDSCVCVCATQNWFIALWDADSSPPGRNNGQNGPFRRQWRDKWQSGDKESDI